MNAHVESGLTTWGIAAAVAALLALGGLWYFGAFDDALSLNQTVVTTPGG